jgi:hypothetical protein
VVAVHRPLAVVERASNACNPLERIAHLSRFAAARPEEPEWCSCPGQQPDGDALGRDVAQELTERRTVLAQAEIRREVPARQVHVRLRSGEVGFEARQRLRSVDEELELRALTRRRVANRPPAGRSVEGARRPPEPPEPAPVVAGDQPLDPVADGRVGASEKSRAASHQGIVGFPGMTAPAATDARRALLERLIDHAALFPPASMTMDGALAEDRRLRAGPHAWLVGRFVVPASRVHELGDAQLALSVVLDAPPPDDPRTEAVESRPGADPEQLVGLAPEVYVEVPLDDGPAGGLLERLAALGLRAKFRCGGASVPSAEALGAAVGRCRELGLPFKATAGLHHALPTSGEHGFLNLLAAAVFGDEEEALRDRDLRLDGDGFTWRGRTARAEEVARVRRELFTGFGSCSVAEPVEELEALHIL